MLIVSLILVLLLYNIVEKLVYSVCRRKLSDFMVIQCIFVGALFMLLCFLEYDLVSGMFLILP